MLKTVFYSKPEWNYYWTLWWDGLKNQVPSILACSRAQALGFLMWFEAAACPRLIRIANEMTWARSVYNITFVFQEVFSGLLGSRAAAQKMGGKMSLTTPKKNLSKTPKRTFPSSWILASANDFLTPISVHLCSANANHIWISNCKVKL